MPRAQRTLAIIFVLVAAVCARLGVWQLDRLEERRTANAAALAQRTRPAVAIEAVPADGDSSLANRQVTASGRYDFANQIILRGQALDGVPGIQIVTPLLLDSATGAVLVERGFVPAPDAITVPALDPSQDTGLVHLRGLALAIGTEYPGEPMTREGTTTWRRLELGALRDTLPYPLRAVSLRPAVTSETASSFPRVLPPPSLDDGPHLSYALQWFGFATIAVAFAVVMWRKRSVSAPLP